MTRRVTTLLLFDDWRDVAPDQFTLNSDAAPPDRFTYRTTLSGHAARAQAGFW